MTELSQITVTRLEKSAIDNGFDLTLPQEDAWLGYASTQSPLRVWLGLKDGVTYAVGLSRQNVADELGEYGTQWTQELPAGAVAGRATADLPSLNRLLRRAFQLSKTLPNELLSAFQQQTATLPRATEAERLVLQRVGQDIFRNGLIEFWEGRCAITGLAVTELLRASHIKPWADCKTDAERMDVFNGFLFAPHLDAAFDRGFITVENDGAVVIADALDFEARRLLGLDQPLRVRAIHEGHRRYLPWHRGKVFRR